MMRLIVALDNKVPVYDGLYDVIIYIKFFIVRFLKVYQ